jgi:hypothetical protein
MQMYRRCFKCGEGLTDYDDIYEHPYLPEFVCAKCHGGIVEQIVEQMKIDAGEADEE